MLTHPTYDRLIALGLTGMARALEEQRSQPDVSALTFEERLALLIDRETAERNNKRLANRLKFAGLRQNAVVEDINLKAGRGLDRAPSANADRRRLDRPQAQPDQHRPNRNRQKFFRLCARPQSLS